MAAIQTLTLVAGGSQVHVTVDFSAVGVSPLDVTWVLDASIMAVQVVADSTGFNFQAPAGMNPPPAEIGGPSLITGNAVATDSTNGAVGVLQVVVSIQQLTFSSP